MAPAGGTAEVEPGQLRPWVRNPGSPHPTPEAVYLSQGVAGGGRESWEFSRVQTLVVKLSILQALVLEGRGREASAPPYTALWAAPCSHGVGPGVADGAEADPRRGWEPSIFCPPSLPPVLQPALGAQKASGTGGGHIPGWEYFLAEKCGEGGGNRHRSCEGSEEER